MLFSYLGCRAYGTRIGLRIYLFYRNYLPDASIAALIRPG
jgi:hypothetical protein